MGEAFSGMVANERCVFMVIEIAQCINIPRMVSAVSDDGVDVG